MTQQEALATIRKGRNVFLTGPAGSGKTHLLREVIKENRAKGKAVAVTASTGIAATHLDGITIHSWAGIGANDYVSSDDIRRIGKVKKIADRIRKADILVIDEISMLHDFRLDIVNEVMQIIRGSLSPFGGAQVILSGDFFQLPPVSRPEDRPGSFAFNATSWDSADLKICYLDEQHRQTDRLMTRILNDIRGNKVTAETRDLLLSRANKPVAGAPKPTRLFPHNERADAINEAELEALPGEPKVFSMTSGGNAKHVSILKRSCLAPETLKLKVGARVMFVKNNFEAGYVNGTTGEVIGFEDGEFDVHPVVKIKSGRTVVARPMQWVMEDGTQIIATISQIPLRLAWAITVHKSQGMSLDAVETDLSKTFVPGMGYVALSRVRTLDGLNLLGINHAALRVSEEILAKDAWMRRRSEELSDEQPKEEYRVVPCAD